MNSIVDSVSLGLPGVCLDGPEAHSHADVAIFARLGLPKALSTNTVDDYVAAAVRLINDRPWLAAMPQGRRRLRPREALLFRRRAPVLRGDLQAAAGVIVGELAAGEIEAAVALWEACGLTRPWNDPRTDIRRALAGATSTILAGRIDGRLVATAMVGADGHRGWVYYLGVASDFRRQGLGEAMMRAAERWAVEQRHAQIAADGSRRQRRGGRLLSRDWLRDRRSANPLAALRGALRRPCKERRAGPIRRP